MFDQLFGQQTDVSGDDLVQLLDRQPDSVVGNPVVRIVIRSDTLAAIARTHQRLSLIGPFFVDLTLLKVVDS